MEVMKLSEHADEEGDYTAQKRTVAVRLDRDFALNQCYRLFFLSLSAFRYKDY